MATKLAEGTLIWFVQKEREIVGRKLVTVVTREAGVILETHGVWARIQLENGTTMFLPKRYLELRRD
jgi:hypothetical protein